MLPPVKRKKKKKKKERKRKVNLDFLLCILQRCFQLFSFKPEHIQSTANKHRNDNQEKKQNKPKEDREKKKKKNFCSL